MRKANNTYYDPHSVCFTCLPFSLVIRLYVLFYLSVFLPVCPPVSLAFTHSNEAKLRDKTKTIRREWSVAGTEKCSKTLKRSAPRTLSGAVPVPLSFKAFYTTQDRKMSVNCIFTVQQRNNHAENLK